VTVKKKTGTMPEKFVVDHCWVEPAKDTSLLGMSTIKYSYTCTECGAMLRHTFDFLPNNGWEFFPQKGKSPQSFLTCQENNIRDILL